MKQSKKLDKYALDYVRPHLYYALYDCCDSMNDAERLENQFSGACDGKINIKKYIETFHLKHYIDSIFKVAKENGDKINKENFAEFLDDSPSNFPPIIKEYFKNYD
jgi:hypothetical protein